MSVPLRFQPFTRTAMPVVRTAQFAEFHTREVSTSANPIGDRIKLSKETKLFKEAMALTKEEIQELAKTRDGIEKLVQAENALNDRWRELDAYRAVFNHAQEGYNAFPSSRVLNEGQLQNKITKGLEKLSEEYYSPILTQKAVIDANLPKREDCTIM